MNYARPESMGYIHGEKDLMKCPPRFIAEYKYNGWAVGISPDKVETRHGKALPPIIAERARANIEKVRSMIDWDFCSMVHAELLCITERACPKDTIIVHDCMGGYSSECFLSDRQTFMWFLPPQMFHGGDLMKPYLQEGELRMDGGDSWDGESGGVWRPKRVRYYDHDDHGHSPDHLSALKDQLRFNSTSGELFYEGFIYKKISAHYGARNAWFKQRIQNQLLKYNKEECYV
jgi:hypothetical protein